MVQWNSTSTTLLSSDSELRFCRDVGRNRLWVSQPCRDDTEEVAVRTAKMMLSATCLREHTLVSSTRQR